MWRYRELLSDEGERDFLANERSVFGYTHAQGWRARSQCAGTFRNDHGHAIYRHHEPGQAEDGI